MDIYFIVNKDAIKFINDNGIIMNYKVLNNKRIVTLSKNGIELGDFYIEGIPNGLLDMSIYIKNDLGLRGKGLAKLMIGYMVINVINFIRKDQLIFIDADASRGFWDYIGMSENRYYTRNQRNVIGRGYEKVITFKDLVSWAIGVKI